MTIGVSPSFDFKYVEKICALETLVTTKDKLFKIVESSALTLVSVEAIHLEGVRNIGSIFANLFLELLDLVYR